MNESQEDLQKLIRLKRHEQPPDGYFDEFLEEFQTRQRGELLKGSSFALLKERFGIWFQELSSLKWVGLAGAAYAGVMAGIFLWPSTTKKIENPDLTPATYQPEKGQPIPTVDFSKMESSQSSSTRPREF